MDAYRLQGPRSVHGNGTVSIPPELLSLLGLTPGGDERVLVGVHGDPPDALVIIREDDAARWMRAGYAAERELRR